MKQLPSRIGLSKEEILDMCKGPSAVTPEVLAEIIDKNNARIFQLLDSVFKDVGDRFKNIDECFEKLNR